MFARMAQTLRHMKLDPNSPLTSDGYVTIRAHFASLAMQSLISNLSMGAEIQRIFDPKNKIADSGENKENPQNYLARVAIAQADAFIEELNK